MLRKFWKDESGLENSDLIEFSLIIALIVIVCVAVVELFSNSNVSRAIEELVSQLRKATGW